VADGTSQPVPDMLMLAGAYRVGYSGRTNLFCKKKQISASSGKNNILATA